MAGRAWPGYVLAQENPDNVPIDVKSVQRALSVQLTGIYGPTTESCVVQFQRANGIGQTGDVGQQTWDALINSTPAPVGLGPNACSWAKNEIGVREKPLNSNWGPRVKDYLTTAGFSTPAPWCIAFVFWAFEQEAKGKGVRNPMLKTASASQLFDWAVKMKKTVASPQLGDIFLVRGGSTGHFHGGFVAANPKHNLFQTVEGNSNDSGSYNGVEVVSRSPGRAVSSCDFVRL